MGRSLPRAFPIFIGKNSRFEKTVSRCVDTGSDEFLLENLNLELGIDFRAVVDCADRLGIGHELHDQIKLCADRIQVGRTGHVGAGLILVDHELGSFVVRHGRRDD